MPDKSFLETLILLLELNISQGRLDVHVLLLSNS